MSDQVQPNGRDAEERLSGVLGRVDARQADVAESGSAELIVQPAGAEPRAYPLTQDSVTLGSAGDNEIVLPYPFVSRYLATLRRTPSGYRLEPAPEALSPILVGGRRLEGALDLTAGAFFRVPGRGHGEFLTCVYLPADREPEAAPASAIAVPEAAGSGGMLVEAFHLNCDVGHDTNLLHDVSLRIRPRELVAVVGSSGAGKSTLVNALAGYRPATSGQVKVDDIDLYRNFNRFRTSIGYVPQRDIVHLDLTVFEALDYAAQLRMPPGTSPAERHQRVAEVLADLGLGEHRDQIVRSLSGGQLKRVSIGVELITRPSLFFLDEPTSGLDPGTETGLMHLLRNLADHGRTVILITHATRNILLADKVIFMTHGGGIAWFGPPSAAMTYFDAFRPERERHDRPMEFDRIYELLEDPVAGTPQDWEERFRASDAYRRFIAEPLGLDSSEPEVAPPAPPPEPQPSMLRQLLVLSRRNLRLIMRDRFALVLMLGAAPLLAMLDFLITKRGMFDVVNGDTLRIITNTNTIIVDAMLVGALSQAREIIKDTDIYRRERLVTLKIVPYILSKVWVAALLAVYQAATWVAIRYLAVDMPGGLHVAAGFYLTIFLATFAGMMLGLFASAVAPSEDSVTLIIALLIVPQFLFSGAHLPVQKLNRVVQAEMNVMPSRWAFEALITESGYGKDLASDPCWKLSPSQRAALTPEQEQTCPCYGVNVLQRCDFPGVQSFAPPEGASPEAIRQAVTMAEGRLAVDYDYYGRVYDVNLLSRWLALLGIAAGLIGIVMGIQKLKERV